MKLALVKSLWGVPASNGTAGWEDMFVKIAHEGYAAVETIGLVWSQDADLFKSLLLKNDLKFIAQIHTAGGNIRGQDYVYCSSCHVPDHVESFRAQVLAALKMDPVIINVHSGHDSWNSELVASYFKQVLAIEKEIVPVGVTVVHETHRQRLMFNPFQALEILSNPELSDIKINADLSHWVCVCERLFDDVERDPWWPGLLAKLAEKCHFIHGRIGHAEGPQIFDPRRKDLFSAEINAHFSWWDVIWKSQRERGLEYSFVETEHGPEPYQAYFSLPAMAKKLDEVEANDCGVEMSAEKLSEFEKGEILWAINAHMAMLLTERYSLLA